MKSILTLTLIFIIQLGCAQTDTTSNLPVFVYNGTEFNKRINDFVRKNSSIQTYLSNYISHHYPKIYQLCDTRTVLIKFRFSDYGLITDITCSNDTPQDIESILKSAIKASELYWSLPAYFNKRTWLIQPVVYKYGINCVRPEHDFISSYMKLFNFRDKQPTDALSCALLAPLVMSSGVDDRDLVPIKD